MSTVLKRGPEKRLAIHELLRGRPTPQKIDAFLSDREVPIPEGNSVTFLYRGEADAVFLNHWIYGLPTKQPFQRVVGSDLWFLVLELPKESRVEYKLEVVHGNEHRLIKDPLNPREARDPFGANSVCTSEGYVPPDWVEPDEDCRLGEIEDHEIRSKALGETRPFQIYLPARYRKSRRYPLLVVHDGTDYVNYAAFKIVLDNLIHRLEIPSMIVALTDSPHRMVEYAHDPSHAKFLHDELVPFLEKKFPVTGSPNGRGLVGASFGAVASFSAAWHHPKFFGRLLLQSGSFAFTDIGPNPRGPVFEPIVEFVNQYRENPTAVTDRLFLSCGTYESLIYENRSLVPILQDTGMQVKYVEARDGHNWENWRDRLRAGLSWLFPGPLWMVYE